MKSFNPTYFTAVVIFFLNGINTSAQVIQWEYLVNMPEAVSNNAVASATVDDTTYIYSFAGIDTSRDWFGIHLKGFRYNVQSQVWDTIAPLPDPNGGKIAAGASNVKGKIYIIGGYHVASNYSEISSAKVHIYDPTTNSYLPDGADIPVAIDDQVQAVWRDSLIYVITGWSNSNNVNNVQIYNPSTDTWTTGTPVPNNSQYKVFGGSGTIVGDSIYYIGGARLQPMIVQH
jgi:N-acetylneuraminic acid mutarotase